MSEEQTKFTSRFVIGRSDMKNKILSFEDGSFKSRDGELVEKIVLNYTEYGGEVHPNLQHSMDVDDFALMVHDMLSGRPINGPDGKDYVEHKGSTNKDGAVISRVLRVSFERKEGVPPGYWVSLSQGPGEKKDTGAVVPAGEPTSKGSFKLTMYEARRIALQSKMYLEAKMVKKVMEA